MKYIKSKNNYYYKVYNSGKKKRISKNEYYKKTLMRGSGPRCCDPLKSPNAINYIQRTYNLSQLIKTNSTGGLSNYLNVVTHINSPENTLVIKSIKIPPTKNKNHDHKMRAIENERRILDILKENKVHQNICKYYGYFQSEQNNNSVYACFVFENLSEQEGYFLLFEIRNILSYFKKVGILMQIANALAFLNSEIGIIHGDLKPENIMYNYTNNTVKLIDFGISYLKDEKTKVGTISFLAPEYYLPLWQNHGNHDKFDVWAFGILFSELIIGKICFGPLKDCYDEFSYYKRYYSFSPIRWKDYYKQTNFKFVFEKTIYSNLNEHDKEILDSTLINYTERKYMNELLSLQFFNYNEVEWEWERSLLELFKQEYIINTITFTNDNPLETFKKLKKYIKFISTLQYLKYCSYIKWILTNNSESNTPTLEINFILDRLDKYVSLSSIIDETHKGKINSLNNFKMTVVKSIGKFIKMLHDDGKPYLNLNPDNIMVLINEKEDTVDIKYTNLHYCSTRSYMSFDFYSAPEINTSKRNMITRDTKHDIWAFGVLIAYVFTGKKIHIDISLEDISQQRLMTYHVYKLFKENIFVKAENRCNIDDVLSFLNSPKYNFTKL